MGSQYSGNVSVSAVKNFIMAKENGEEERAKEVIAGYGEDIRPEPYAPRNAEILYGEFPEEHAVKGVLHDAAVNLYLKETGFRDLGVDPGFEGLRSILTGSIDGSAPATSELRSSVANLRMNYGLGPQDVIEYRFPDGSSFDYMLETVAENRTRNWKEETRDITGMNVEKWVNGKGMTGRADIEAWTDGGRELKELKLRDARGFFRSDKIQAAAYGLIEDAPVTLESPLTSISRDIDPEEYSFEIYNARDQLRSVIGDFQRLQDRQMKMEDDREKATREALDQLEVF